MQKEEQQKQKMAGLVVNRSCDFKASHQLFFLKEAFLLLLKMDGCNIWNGCSFLKINLKEKALSIQIDQVLCRAAETGGDGN